MPNQSTNTDSTADLIERLEHLAEHIGDDDYHLPLLSKSAVLEAAKTIQDLTAGVRRLCIDGEDGRCIGCGVFIFQKEWEHDPCCVFNLAAKLESDDTHRTAIEPQSPTP